MSDPVAPVVIIVPVLDRPHRVDPTLDDIVTATPLSRVLFVADAGDRPELEALRSAGAEYITVPGGTCYAAKINAGAAASSEPLLFTAADDLHFHPGWFEAAVAKLDGTVQVVGTNDLGNKRTITGEHSTHTLVTRHYVDTVGGTVDGGPGEVLHPGYPHEYCDDELIATARARGVYAHAADSVVEHLHYLWGKGEVDETYRKGRSRTRHGRKLFHLRRRLWESL